MHSAFRTMLCTGRREGHQLDVALRSHHPGKLIKSEQNKRERPWKIEIRRNEK